jgi:hypothetical protein
MANILAASQVLAYAMMAGAFVGVALLIGVFGPSTNARSLEAIARGPE